MQIIIFYFHKFTLRYKIYFTFGTSFITPHDLFSPQNPPFKTPQLWHLMTRYDVYRPIWKSMLPAGCKLTSYTSRHSWATAARNHNVPISVISAGMGHTSEQTTQIYLTMLENSVIDDANQGLIRSLLE